MSRDPADVLLDALVAAARRRRAARELAEEEFEAGTYADVDDEDEELVRLAAGPEVPTSRSYRAGAVVVELVARGGLVVARQVSGAAGITLVVGEARVPLGAEEVGYPADAMPDQLLALDARGRWVRLD
jgi:hypothetical protein